jgi:hypothetical protein
MCSELDPRNDRHSTHESTKARIAYRWHPLFGKRVVVVRRVRVEGKEYAHVEGRGQFSREFPAWMLDDAICSSMDLGPPQLSMTGLLGLAEVIRADLVAIAAPPQARSSDEEEPRECVGKARSTKPVRGGTNAPRDTSGNTRRGTQRNRRTSVGRGANKRKGGYR